MSKYSSDSDSSGDDSYHRRKKNSGRSKGRSRSSSESSSSGSRHSTARKRSRKKRKCKSRRSRSRDRKTKSSRSRHNRSGDDRSRSSLRSKSWSRSRSNSKSRSTSPTSSKRLRTYKRSPSSGSQDSHNRTELKSNARASSSREAALGSSSGTGRSSNEDQLSAKLQAAIRAAQTADQLLRQQGVLLPPPQMPTSTSTASTKPIASNNPNRNINVSEHTDPGALDEINAPGFVQRNFVSNGRVETSSEQAADIISSVVANTLANKAEISSEKDSLFHPNLLVNSQVKMDKWVKKLFTLRQKAINGEPLV